MSTYGFFLHPWQSTVIISRYRTFLPIFLQHEITSDYLCMCVCAHTHTTWCTHRPQVSLGCHPSDTVCFLEGSSLIALELAG